jgi:hypothetical protein
MPPDAAARADANVFAAEKNAAVLSALHSKPTHHALPPLPSYVASRGKCDDRVDRHARRADQYTR